MKIVILALHFAEYSARLALALAEQHTVMLILNAQNARHELPESLRQRLDGSVRILEIQVRRLRDPRVIGVIAAINRSIREFAPDILHIQEYHQAFTGWPIVAVGRLVPVILTVHDPVPHSGSLDRHGWRWSIVQWFRSRCCRLIVHGTRNREDMLSYNRSVHGRVDVVPHGILGRDAVERDFARCDPHTFLFFGRIESYKGLRYLLDAGEILNARGRRFRLLIAGRGADLDRHRSRMHGVPWIELIERFIPADEITALFKRALAVVLPYTDATQSGVTAIAFAHSRPVIASAVGDVPEVVIDGESGLIVPPRDAVALADAMERLLEDRRLRDRLAAGAARTAERRLAWCEIATQTLRVYRRALHTHGTAA